MLRFFFQYLSPQIPIVIRTQLVEIDRTVVISLLDHQLTKFTVIVSFVLFTNMFRALPPDIIVLRN